MTLYSLGHRRSQTEEDLNEDMIYLGVSETFYEFRMDIGQKPRGI